MVRMQMVFLCVCVMCCSFNFSGCVLLRVSFLINLVHLVNSFF